MTNLKRVIHGHYVDEATDTPSPRLEIIDRDGHQTERWTGGDRIARPSAVIHGCCPDSPHVVPDGSLDDAETFVVGVVESHRPAVSAVVRFRGRGGRRLASRLSHVLASVGYVVTDSGGTLIVTDRRLETEIARHVSERLEIVGAARMIAVNGGEWERVEELGELEAVLTGLERVTDRIIGSGGVR